VEYPLWSFAKNIELDQNSIFFWEQSLWSWTCLTGKFESRATKGGAEQSQTGPYLDEKCGVEQKNVEMRSPKQALICGTHI